MVSLEIQSLSIIGSGKMKVKYFYSKRERPKTQLQLNQSKTNTHQYKQLGTQCRELTHDLLGSKGHGQLHLSDCLSSAPHPAGPIGSGQLCPLPAAVLHHTCVLTSPICWGLPRCFTFINGLLASILGLQTCHMMLNHRMLDSFVSGASTAPEASSRSMVSCGLVQGHAQLLSTTTLALPLPRGPSQHHV